MRKSYGVTLYCRRQKIRRDGRAPVEVTVSVNGEKAMFQLEEAWEPMEFARMRDSGRQNEVRRLCSQVTSQMDSLREKYPDASAKLLKQYYLSGPPTPRYTGVLVEHLCHAYLEDIKKRSPSYDKYRVTFDRFCSFCRGMRSDDVTSGDIVMFITGLRKQGFAEGTLRNYYKRLKCLFAYGFERRVVEWNPFSGLKLTFNDPPPIYLTKSELELIKKVELPPYLDRVRELFLFLCGTGIEWADLERLCPDDVKVSKNGLRYIDRRRVKTGVPYKAIMIGDAPAIWDKYRGILPLISNQKENKYLKQVAEIAGIPKRITTLTGRHAYATALLSGSYGPAIGISFLPDALGHTNMTQSLRYAEVLDESYFNAFEGYQ